MLTLSYKNYSVLKKHNYIYRIFFFIIPCELQCNKN